MMQGDWVHKYRLKCAARISIRRVQAPESRGWMHIIAQYSGLVATAWRCLGPVCFRKAKLGRYCLNPMHAVHVQTYPAHNAAHFMLHNIPPPPPRVRGCYLTCLIHGAGMVCPGRGS